MFQLFRNVFIFIIWVFFPKIVLLWKLSVQVMQHWKEGCCACVAQMTGGGIWRFWGDLCKKGPLSVGFPLLLQSTDPRWLFPLPQEVCAHEYMVHHFAVVSW